VHAKRTTVIALRRGTAGDEDLGTRLLVDQDEALREPLDDFRCRDALPELLTDDVDDLLVDPDVDVARPGVLHRKLVHLDL
jgi:hypothetical protein